MKLPGPTGGCPFLAAHVYNLSHISCDKTLQPKQLMGGNGLFWLTVAEVYSPPWQGHGSRQRRRECMVPGAGSWLVTLHLHLGYPLLTESRILLRK